VDVACAIVDMAPAAANGQTPPSTWHSREVLRVARKKNNRRMPLRVRFVAARFLKAEKCSPYPVCMHDIGKTNLNAVAYRTQTDFIFISFFGGRKWSHLSK